MPGDGAAAVQAESRRGTSAPERRTRASIPVRQLRLHYGALVIVSVLLILVALGPHPENLPATAALACGLGAMVICLVWAIRVSRTPGSVASYVKATTTSRMMVWFWLALGATTMVTALFGIAVENFMTLFEDSLAGFIGIGSILLAAGPAYAEYKEAQHAAVEGR